ncbi:TrmH family RNA methyltransferase [Aquabacterium sp. OR-4]|uniref:TrmH family RNA methyltransferase n=1 Tax=Aquabacterium sp. OR-4 TaxID=2978127 RepID=UPI0021B34C37|nr:RNA methyltransferase [Aquabacterium sp. OR-4]MDT7835447.1 RNA methyltransferase [Aquabacterium sp. OR-4]
MPDILEITSRDNPLLVKLRKLARDPGGYRKAGMLWLEGDHLCSALRARGGLPQQALIAESAWVNQPALRALAEAAPQVRVLPDALFEGLSGLESPARLGYVLALPAAPAIAPDLATVVLDRVQDAGNVGSILRSAAAFGVGQVLALRGTAALWSPKVLRAGMGAHFGLRLIEGLDAGDLSALAVPLVGTSLATDHVLPTAALPSPCAWVLGHEGQGVAAELLARCALTVRIPQPGGEESLNVAAAAAVCLYESARR